MKIKEITSEETLKIRQEVMWPEKSLEFVKVDGDEKGTHYGLFEDTKLICVISMFYRDKEVQFRKFATLTTEQGKGYGTKLLKFVFNEAFKKGVQRIWCNARTNKVDFYKSFGMKETNKVFSKNGIKYVIMEIKITK